MGIPIAKTDKIVSFEGVIFSGGWSSEGFDEGRLIFKLSYNIIERLYNHS
jgi:hypothetical protein